MKSLGHVFLGTAAMLFAIASALPAQDNANTPALKAYVISKPADKAALEATKNQLNSFIGPGPTLPLWTYTIDSSRDGSNYSGVIVGTDPFSAPASTSVPTYILPLIVRTNTVGTDIDPKTLTIKTTPGATTFNPLRPDYGCLAAPNNVPFNVFLQSPIFNPATFAFGGTVVGTTQYVDAFQRASFWQALGSNADSYHVLLSPIKILSPQFINVPAQYGTTLPIAACGPTGIVDINWFDAYLSNQILPVLAAQGVNASTFPIFMVNNVVWAGQPTDLLQCCVLGYHGTNGYPIQTYSPADFDTTGLFGTGAMDSAILSHEVAEWMNDPFGDNPTPPWGHTGQVAGCQGNLEVGDPLSGRESSRISMPNGYTYHLQELAFFSWFFGAPSTGIHNWYSNNATFLTDAGAVCSTSGSGSAEQTPLNPWVSK